MESIKTVWSKIPMMIKWILAAILAIAVAFAAGRFTTLVKTQTVTRTETVTQVVEKEVEVVKWKDRVVTQYVNQSTLKAERDSDCVETFDKDTGKIVTRHCVVAVNTNSEHKDSGSAVATKEGSTSTVETKTSTVETKTSTITTPATPGSWSGSLIVSEGLSLRTSKLSPSYGIELGYHFIGPLSLGLEGFASKDVIGSLSLGFSTMAVSADVGTNLGSFGKLYYGGYIGHKLLGNLWAGVWGYSTGAVGLSASIRIF